MNTPNDPEPKSKVSINYLYFGILLFFMLFLSIYKVFLIKAHADSRLFFLIHSIGQCILEISIVVFLSWVISKFLPKTFFYFFIGLTFLFFLTHLIDFVIHRILDLSVWSALDFVLDESFSNLIEMLHASGIPLMIWGMMLLIVLSIPVFGILFFHFTQKLIKKKPLNLDREVFLQSIFCIPLALFIWDYSAHRLIEPDSYYSYQVILPWKTTFIHPMDRKIHLKSPLKKPPTEQQVLHVTNAFQKPLKKKPNIYLFIIESLREDFIQSAHAPTISQFKNDYYATDLSLSNANATMVSWFSLFHSNYPIYWAYTKKQNWSSGSPPLKVLKQLGYKVHVFSSAQLIYYGMDELIFGKDRHLADQYHLYPHYYPVKAHETDTKTVDAFEKVFDQDPTLQEGQVFIFFWDATHFDYSWPEKSLTKFLPYGKENDFFKIHPSQEEIELLKNRYRNSIYFADTLFKRFQKNLQSKGLWNDSIIAVMGDHGEEFYEQGHLFHCSHLAHVQTHIPLYLKFGTSKEKINLNRTLCHMDVFPSIFDYLTGDQLYPYFMKGHSIFDDAHWPYVITARYNASRSPYEFFIHNGKKKVILRFSDRKNIFSADSLQLLSIKNLQDQSLIYPEDDLESYVLEEFGPALDQLFNVMKKQ